jgi:hypothetical protein
MQGGDISNTVLPRSIMVWEGLIALPPHGVAGLLRPARRAARRWATAVKQYEPNSIAVNELIRVTYGPYHDVDLVTFLPKEAEDPVNEWLMEWNIPGRATATTPNKLASDLVSWPHVLRVYDPDPSHAFRYGGKGRNVNPFAPDFRS